MHVKVFQVAKCLTMKEINVSCQKLNNFSTSFYYDALVMKLKAEKKHLWQEFNQFNNNKTFLKALRHDDCVNL